MIATVRIEQKNSGGMIHQVAFTAGALLYTFIEYAQLPGQLFQSLVGTGDAKKITVEVGDKLGQPLGCIPFRIDGDHDKADICIDILQPLRNAVEDRQRRGTDVRAVGVAKEQE